VLTALTLSASLAACGGDEPQGGTDAEGLATAPEVQLGYFANVTHAPALIGLDQGDFEDELGDTTLQTQTFNARTDAIEAIFAGAWT